MEVGRAHRKDPSHAWRHRFKTLARAARINDSVADAIVGHAADTVAKAYGTVTLQTMKEAIERMPVRARKFNEGYFVYASVLPDQEM